MTLQIVGEQLCEALDLRAGQKILDVAAGNGNVSLAAARRCCDVVSTDYVPSLLERGRARASAGAVDVLEALVVSRGGCTDLNTSTPVVDDVVTPISETRTN